MATKQKKDISVDDSFQAIGLKIYNEEYGLPIEAVQEIITAPHITRVPKAVDYIMGVINLRGNVIPVMDIARRFKIGTTSLGEKGKIVAVESHGEIVGLAVEKVSKVTRLSQKAIKPPPPLVSGIAAEYLKGVARLPDRFLIFLNLEKVLAEDHDGQER
jgi:purine-binding chemotaxis protein CheW